MFGILVCIVQYSTQKIPKEANVPVPTQSEVQISKKYSPQVLENRAREEGQRKAQLWSKYAPSFKIDKTLEELFAERTNNKAALAKLAKYCDEELQSTPIIPYSCKYLDSNNTCIAAYFAARLDQPEVSALDIVSDVSILLVDLLPGKGFKRTSSTLRPV